MIDVLRQHIINRLGKSTENLELVLSRFSPRETKRQEQLLTQGEVCQYVYFVASGCLQVYTYDHDMNETTRVLLQKTIGVVT